MNDKKKTNQECYIGIVQYLGFKYSKALCFTNLKSRMKENKEWKLIIWFKKYKYSDVATYCTLDKKRMFSSQIYALVRPDQASQLNEANSPLCGAISYVKTSFLYSAPGAILEKSQIHNVDQN